MTDHPQSLPETLPDALATIVGPDHVLTGEDAAPFSRDFLGGYHWQPIAVVRPADTDQVARVMRACHGAGVPVVPVGGNTGLAGGTAAQGAVMVSLARMNRIRAINPDARTAEVEAGVILDQLHAAAGERGLSFPMTFGARGSCMIGGMLSTNAGGSNVLRYGNTRALTLGIEVVLADGRVLNLMSALHKDNTGYDLKDLFIGAEGTLGIITAAVLKLVVRPRAHATAMVATRDLRAALDLLNRLQEATGGAVEAFEYMPADYIARHLALHPEARPPFAQTHPVNILVELGVTAPRDATPGPDGALPVVRLLEDTLADLMQAGALDDAVIARNEAERAEMWARREAAAEILMSCAPRVDTDIALPLDAVAVFLERMAPALARLDSAARPVLVAHLGDGNIHYSVEISRDDPALKEAITERIEDEVKALGGSFSAEHGIGLSKRGTMRRRKDPVALEVMRAIKAALDPDNIMNPGKVLP